MGDLVNLAVPLCGLIGLGFIGGRVWRTDKPGLKWLNGFVTYFAVPALLFQSISDVPFSQLTNWRFVFVTTLATYVAFAIAFTCAALRKNAKLAEATMQGLVGSYSNIGYLGPPLAIFALGFNAVVPVALIFCFEVALCFTLAHLLLVAFGEDRGNAARTLASVPLRVAFHPFLIATVLGAAVSAWQINLPDSLDHLLTLLRSAAIPAALFAFGVTIAIEPVQRPPKELHWLLIIKLIVHPLVVYLLLTLLGGFDRTWIYTAILMAALPPAVTICVLAEQHGTYREGASSALLIGTACSVLTLTATVFLVMNGLLPDDPISTLSQMIAAIGQ